MHCDRDRRQYPLTCPGWEGFKTPPTRRRVDPRHQRQKDIEVMNKNETSEGVNVCVYIMLNNLTFTGKGSKHNRHGIGTDKEL